MVPWPIRWRQHALAAQRERKKSRYQCPFGIPCPLAMHDHDHVAHVEPGRGRCCCPAAASCPPAWPLPAPPPAAGGGISAVAGSRQRRAARAPCPRAPAASLRHGARARPPAARTRSSRCRAGCWRAPARRWLAPHISLGKIGLFLDTQGEFEDDIEILCEVSKGARGRGPARANQGGMMEL